MAADRERRKWADSVEKPPNWLLAEKRPDRCAILDGRLIASRRG
jgi:hypothetical protein